MQNTTNYNLKKPEYTDFADIADINDNMDTIDAQLAAPTGDSADSTTTFTTSDTADGSASSWTTVPALTSGETHKSLFAKMSQMFKNIRYLYKMLGTTDISNIGNGTVTNALSVLNAKATNVESHIIQSGYGALRMKRCNNVIAFQWNGTELPLNSETFEFISSLPEIYRPPYTIYSALRCSDGTVGYMTLRTNGSVVLNTNETKPAGRANTVSNAVVIVDN